MTGQDRFRGCLLGLACGDAVGAAVEFRARGSFEPVTDMTGGGAFRLQPGQWTDDTSLALCLATSLVETGGFDPADQMARYCRWMDEGYLSSTGRCFDIGSTTARALRRFHRTGEPFSGPTDPRSAGNGSIMRLAPVPMFFHPDLDAAVRWSGDSSRTTHGAAECVDACRLYGAVLHAALSGADRDAALFGHPFADGGDLAPKIADIACGRWRGKTETEIRGSGYVVESLEAALWCVLNTDGFESAILRAVNLGDDADTTAAVCGQLAGALYGERGIPAGWLDRLAMRREISDLADRLRG